MDGRTRRKIVVIKLGGSVLRTKSLTVMPRDFSCAVYTRALESALLWLVSAQNGHTDELETLARRVTNCPNPRTVDLFGPRES